MLCSFYEKEISPPIGTHIPGYYVTRVSTGVKDKLYAKAFAADDGENKVIFIMLDAVAFPKELYEAVVTRIEKFTGVSKNNISIASTHTHLGLPIGNYPDCDADDEFLSVLVRLIADCGISAHSRLEPCTLYYGEGEVDSISFNRNYIMKDGSIQSVLIKNHNDILKPYSGIDPRLPVLFVKNKEGKPIGSLISFACHVDCVGGNEFSGDFPTVLSENLKDKFGRDFVSLFLEGTCGDINHFNLQGDLSIYDETYYIKMGNTLSKEAIKVIENAEKVNSDKIKCEIIRPEIGVRRATKEQIEKAEILAKDYSKTVFNDSTLAYQLLHYESLNLLSCKITVQVMMIGDVFLYSLPGEVYHKFGIDISNSCPSGKSLISTLSNGSNGYIPTPELMDTDIYEASINCSSFYEPEAGNKIVKYANELAEKLATK